MSKFDAFMAIKFVSLFVGLVLSIASFSQLHSKLLQNSSLVLSGHLGSYITVAPKAEFMKDSYSYLGEINFVKQTDGSEQWHAATNFPRWGLAAVFGNSGSKKYIGNIAGVFPFFDFRLIHTGKIKSYFRIGTGLAWVQKPYNVNSNHKNTLIGAHINNISNIAIKGEFRLYNNFYFSGGLSFYHISNGTISLPNLGLNIPALSVGAKMVIGKEQFTSPKIVDTFSKKISYQLITTAGIKQVPYINSKSYLSNFIIFELSKQYSLKGKYGAGFSFRYNPSIENELTTTDIKNIEHLNVGTYLFYEKVIGKISIPLQLGYYLYNKRKESPIYQNVGLRYRFNQHFSSGVYLKTHYGKADLIHAGVGYMF